MGLGTLSTWLAGRFEIENTPNVVPPWEKPLNFLFGEVARFTASIRILGMVFMVLFPGFAGIKFLFVNVAKIFAFDRLIF